MSTYLCILFASKITSELLTDHLKTFVLLVKNLLKLHLFTVFICAFLKQQESWKVFHLTMYSKSNQPIMNLNLPNLSFKPSNTISHLERHTSLNDLKNVNPDDLGYTPPHMFCTLFTELQIHEVIQNVSTPISH